MLYFSMTVRLEQLSAWDYGGVYDRIEALTNKSCYLVNDVQLLN